MLPPAPPPAAPPPAAATPDPGFGPSVPGDPLPPEEDYLNQEDQGEVVKVTIDRRAKSIQELSGTAEAFTEADLERKGVTSMRELTAVSPYIEIGAAEGAIEIYMRGVGNSNNTEIGDPAAAFHIDGIYIPRPRGLGSMFFDLERVEISRGPQGTLRGRNATAGTMNMISAQPKLGKWGASGTFQYGNYMQRLTKGMVNIPIGDTLALRVATFSEKRDPFYKNEGGNWTLRASEDADTWAYRASLKWQPTNDVSVILRHDNTIERGTGWVGSNVTEALQNGILPEEIPDVRSSAVVGVQPFQKLDHLGVSLEINADFGAFNVELLNSYRNLEYEQSTGTTAGTNYPGKPPADLDRYTSSYSLFTSESIVNELRFFAPDAAQFRWTFGGFHLYETQYVFLGQTNDRAWGWAGQEYNHPDIMDGAVAGYADGTLDLLQDLRALAGVRVTHDYKSRDGVGWGYPVNCIPQGQTGYDAACAGREHRFGTEGFRFRAQDRTDYTRSNDLADFTNGIAQFGARDNLLELYQQPGAALPAMTEQHGSTDSTFLDFRVGVEQNPAPNSLLYATFTTGHKAGGFNDTITLRRPDETTYDMAPEFDPETVYATELGSKNEFADRAFTLNGAVFWYAYQNYQASSVESFGGPQTCPGPADVNYNMDCRAGQATSIRKNTGDARVLGLELDLVARLPEGFTGRVSSALLDARFLGAEVNDTRASWDPGMQTPTNLDGNFLPRAPQLALAYGIEQTIPTGIGYFDWSLSGQSKSKMYLTYFNGEGRDLQGNINPLFSDVVPWTHRFDASVGYTRPEGDIRLEAFAANITNMTYMTSIINAPGLNLRFYNPPRQVGVRFSLYL